VADFLSTELTCLGGDQALTYVEFSIIVRGRLNAPGADVHRRLPGFRKTASCKKLGLLHVIFSFFRGFLFRQGCTVMLQMLNIFPFAKPSFFKTKGYDKQNCPALTQRKVAG
jgi:hypothetical protein